MDGGAWYTVHGVAKSQDMTERLHFHIFFSATKVMSADIFVVTARGGGNWHLAGGGQECC